MKRIFLLCAFLNFVFVLHAAEGAENQPVFPIAVDIVTGHFAEKSPDLAPSNETKFALYRSFQPKESELYSKCRFAKGWFFEWEACENCIAIYDDLNRLTYLGWEGRDTFIQIYYLEQRIDLVSSSGEIVTYTIDDKRLTNVLLNSKEEIEYTYLKGHAPMVQERKEKNGPWLKFSYLREKVSSVEISYDGKSPYEPLYNFTYLLGETRVEDVFEITTSYFFNRDNAVYYQDNLHPIEALQCWLHKKMEAQGGFLFNLYLKWRKYSNMDSEHMLLEIFGETNLMLLGYYSTEAESGVRGSGEVSDKVRVSFINGILTNTPSLVQNLEGLSDSHGGVNIHYVYRPTKGWTWDLLHCLFVELGVVSPYAIRLANDWKQMIVEMGGTEGGGKIIHYAHSIGTIETLRALELMTKEERKMISVYAFGSPSLFTDVPEIQHYASVRDGVSLIDVPHFVEAYMNPDDPVYMSGTLLGIPLADHLFTCPTYKVIWTGMGRTFVETHGSVKQ